MIHPTVFSLDLASRKHLLSAGSPLRAGARGAGRAGAQSTVLTRPASCRVEGSPRVEASARALARAFRARRRSRSGLAAWGTSVVSPADSVTCPEGERLWLGPHWLAVGALYSSITFHVCVCAGGEFPSATVRPPVRPPGEVRGAHSSGRKMDMSPRLNELSLLLAFALRSKNKSIAPGKPHTCCRSAERLPIAQPKRLAAPPCLTAARPCLTLRRWRRVPSANRHHGNPGVRADGGSAR